MGSLVDDLQRPDAYPAPRPSSIELKITHASWVFLTDMEAWKVKRPVDYGFLDFSTLERRRHFCEVEVRLNKRRAPGVYRGVVEIRLGRDGRHYFGPGGSGSIVDHAVRMKRLPNQDSAEHMLGVGRLDFDAVERLAAQVARWFGDAPLRPHFGSPAVWAGNLSENFEGVRPYVGRFVDAQVFETVSAWQQGFLAAEESRFDERMTDERIREGHGDLRLEHIYFPQGSSADPPIAIDAIEFNERFRCQDVALEVAFLAMELDARDRADLSAWLFSSWARAANDYGAYPLYDFYLSYRAWVRGKVACFVAADPSTAADKAKRKADEATRLFALAADYARPHRRQSWVLAVGGMIGAGKSTVADTLSRHLGVPAVSSDTTRKFLGGVAATRPGPPGLYNEEFDRRTFDEVCRRAASVLDSGRGVILDATFRRADQRRRARSLAERHDGPFVFVEVKCAEDEIRRRLRRRTGTKSVSDAREETLPMVSASFEAITDVRPGEHVVVNTDDDGTRDTQLRGLCQRLAQLPSSS